MSTLRSRLIKLAYQNPDLRGDLLPLLNSDLSKSASDLRLKAKFRKVIEVAKSLQEDFAKDIRGKAKFRSFLEDLESLRDDCTK